MSVDAIFAGVGRFCVRFRWLVLVFWIVAAVLTTALLPALSSVTQGDNTKFLPDDAPTQKATALAAPFGTADLFLQPMIITRVSAALSAAFLQAISAVLPTRRHVVKDCR